METVEIIGIAASVLVLISFLFKNIRTIRIISIVGCIVFVVYGLLIGALSIWLLNGILILVHIYFLIRMRKGKKPTQQQTAATQPAQATQPIKPVRHEGQRLGTFSHDSFDKKGLRSRPSFVASDID